MLEIVYNVVMVREIFSLCAPSKGQRPAEVQEIEEKELECDCKHATRDAKLKNFSFTFLGRVHSAMVSKLNPAQRSVTVEWYERGETKGKEVELDMLLALNPELIQNKQSYVAPPPSATAPVNLQRVSKFEFARLQSPPMPSWQWDITKLC